MSDSSRVPVFGYGSNNILQIRERVQNPETPSSKGLLLNHHRVFMGHSKRWDGAPASVEAKEGANCRGTIVWLSAEELGRLDGFEGCKTADCGNPDRSKNVYRRELVEVQVWPGKTEEAIELVKACINADIDLCGKTGAATTSDIDNSEGPVTLQAWCYKRNDNPVEYGQPSGPYIAAIMKNLEEYWEKDVEEELGPDLISKADTFVISPAPSPEAISGQWEVVGGADKGGILVRDGQELTSKALDSRLSHGAVVEGLHLAGDRLHYRLVTGSGPQEGWVSLKISSGTLLTKKEGADCVR
eukprot:TRINITY_DN6197_c0_g2_i3.p1 TRINITY_DN6197_c0_g2~~TRINITY_DN6197_c0_g2_i3.p1  ORF type:complete len:300 (-),score=48.98 TRINITY_DN6197_c0_g2_i3:249-1148(-)